MNWLLKLLASIKIKNGVAYAYQVSALLVDALRGILLSDGLSDERRRQLQIIFNAAISIRDFLGRLSELIGAPALSSISSLEHLSDRASTLDRITDEL